MADLFPFKDIPGLFSSPAQSSNARNMALMSAAAALLKSGEYSVMPVSPWAQLGQGLSGLVEGYRTGTDDALKKELMRGQIQQRNLALGKFMLEAQALGIDPSKFIGLGGPTAAAPAGGAPQGGPVVPGAPTPGMPAAPAAPAAPVPSLLSPIPMARQPGLPPGMPAPGAAPTAPNAGAPTPGMPAPGAAPPAPPSAVSVLRTLAPADKAMLLGSDKVGSTLSGIITDNLKTTNEQKNATSSGFTSPFAYDVAKEDAKKSDEERTAARLGMDVGAYKAWSVAVNEAGKAKGERIAEAIKGGGEPARDTIMTLNAVEDAVRQGGDNIFTGPFAEQALKVKEFLKNAGVDVKGVPESEMVSKMNAYLAAQATKAISSRPAQFEFQTFLKNNPGLLTSTDGTLKLIDILRQQATHKVKLGRLALDEKNVKNWGDVEDQFYKDNPIVSPFTGKPLGAAAKTSEAAPVPKAGDVLKGYRFKGGDPALPASWEKVQ